MGYAPLKRWMGRVWEEIKLRLQLFIFFIITNRIIIEIKIEFSHH